MRICIFLAAMLLLLPALQAQEWSTDKTEDHSTDTSKTPVDASTLPGMAPAANGSPEETPSEEQTPSVQEPSEEPATGYEVKQGDTLWGLAGRFFQDPYKWKNIWEANKDLVKDPDLIFPQQRFTIPGRAGIADVKEPVEPAEEPEAEAEEPEQAQAPEEPAQEEPAAEPEKKAESSVSMEDRENGGFVADPKWKGDGRIVGDQDKKMLISQDDIVYLDIGLSEGVREGMRGVIYRKSKRVIKNLETREKLGVMVRRIGMLRIANVEENRSTAVILTSVDPVKIGDAVKLTR
ncbi:MAG: LysM peptidoglycan-binding domain-containing protein [Elusimicrobia bacterium]|nr:LysM peptidoglycan-binding domain-containing protein [Elusimicrobiota bacterium]